MISWEILNRFSLPLESTAKPTRPVEVLYVPMARLAIEPTEEAVVQRNLCMLIDLYDIATNFFLSTLLICRSLTAAVLGRPYTLSRQLIGCSSPSHLIGYTYTFRAIRNGSFAAGRWAFASSKGRLRTYIIVLISDSLVNFEVGVASVLLLF